MKTIESTTNKTDAQLLNALTTAGKAAAEGGARLSVAIVEAFQSGIDRQEIRDHLLETTPLAPSTIGQYLSTALCSQGKRQRKEGGGATKNPLAETVIHWLMTEHGLDFKKAKSAALAASRLKEEPTVNIETEKAPSNVEQIAA